MKKIKIAQIITRLDWGGPPDIMRLICNSLTSDAYDFKLITGPSVHASAKTAQFLNCYRDRVVTVPELQRDIHPLKDFVALIKLCRLFKKNRFDIVHTHTAKAGVLGRIAAWLVGGSNIIHTSHGHNFYGYFGPGKSRLVVTVERLLTRITTRLTALTELEKCDLDSYNVAGPDKVAVINSGLELDLYRKAGIDSARGRNELHVRHDTLLVGMIGRLEPVKGPEYFIEAAPLVLAEFPDVKFLIVGEGTLRTRLESRCRELKIAGRVIFTGWRENIPEILTTLDIVVLPSLNEAVGRILLEAGACGKPVVATAVGGIPEVVRDEETGMLVSPRDAKALAGALITLLKDREKRTAMGESAQQWVDDRFSASTMVERFTELYEELGS
jgi:glycosyltransferase involved in cell wall biosynthesis